MELRTDRALWENFIVSERVKFNVNNQEYMHSFYWRTQQQQKRELIEERQDKLIIFKLNYSYHKKVNFSKAFVSNYHPGMLDVVHKENYIQFLNQ